MKTLFSSKWVYLIVVGATALALWGTYSLGSSSGEASVQKKWDDQKIADLREANRLKDENALKEAKHRTEVDDLQKELRDAKSSHESELARIDAEYADRLRKSEGRAAIYQRQAEGGAAQCRSLASHAARLDASLEEGRQLVEELRATLGLRDRQLIQLGEQIKADRRLFE